MKKLLLFVFAGALALSACGGHASDEVEAHKPWARAAAKDGNSAAYMLIHNHTSSDVALVGASSEVSAVVEVHLSSMGADGVMKMEKQDSVVIPAGGELELKPGSYHIMFIGLKRDLNAGDSITVTLHFSGYEDITLTVPVKDAGEMGGSGMDGHHMP